MTRTEAPTALFALKTTPDASQCVHINKAARFHGAQKPFPSITALASVEDALRLWDGT